MRWDILGDPQNILSNVHFSWHCCSAKVFTFDIFTLPDKKKVTYFILARILRDNCGDLKGVVILLDFKIGAVNAFKEVFLRAIIKLCYFYFYQNIYRNVWKKFKNEYLNDHEFAGTSMLLA